MNSPGIFITGTDTDVGKTYIGTQIVSLLHDNGISVAPRKPIESGCTRKGEDLIPEDSQKYFDACQQSIDINTICPFRFEPAISPQRAARLVKQPVYTRDLVNSCSKNKNEFLVVEGAGGFYSPLCEDGLNADFAEKLKLPIVLVANDKLGCLNHILLTMEAIKKRNLELIAIYLNKIQSSDDEAMNNFEDLKKYTEIPIFQNKFNECLIDNSTHTDFLLSQIKKGSI